MMNRALSKLRMVVAAVVASGFTGNALAQSPRTPAPVMTDELMARLIKFTRGSPKTGGVNGKICLIFDLCDGTKVMPLMLVQSDPATDGEHFFGLPLNAASKDVLIMRKRKDGAVEAFLTDNTGKLRAAAIHGTTGDARLITNEKAATQFKAELALFAKEAAEQLPAK